MQIKMVTKIVIVEGSDLSGKTTFIEKLSKSLNNGYVVKNTYKPRKPEDSKKIQEQYNHIITMLRKSAKIDLNDRVIILDRFYPSQVVYSYLRGTDEKNGRFYKRIEERMQNIESAEVFYIWITAPMTHLLDRYDKRGEDYLSKADLKKINERYEVFYHNCKLKKQVIINPDGASIEEAVGKAINFLNK